MNNLFYHISTHCLSSDRIQHKEWTHFKVWRFVEAKFFFWRCSQHLNKKRSGSTQVPTRAGWKSTGILTNPLCRGISINFAAAKCLSAVQYFLQTFLWFRPPAAALSACGPLLTGWKRYTSLVGNFVTWNKKSLFWFLQRRKARH